VVEKSRGPKSRGNRRPRQSSIARSSVARPFALLDEKFFQHPCYP
jgi:hypothetical protein